jgi:coenzyme F420-reducing hydrogenase gamma subunit
MIPIKGCPPTYDSIRKAFVRAGIELSPLFGDLKKTLAYLMDMYKDQPDFNETFYAIQK